MSFFRFWSHIHPCILLTILINPTALTSFWFSPIILYAPMIDSSEEGIAGSGCSPKALKNGL